MSKKKQPDALSAAHSACDDLRRHLRGENPLTPRQMDVKRTLIKIASESSFYFFSKSVLGFDRLTARTHKRWADDLQKRWLETDYLMRLKPRGTYKTTLYGEAFVLWVWATISPKIRFAYISANQALLDEVSAHLNHFIGLQTESLYDLVFGIKRDKTAQQNTSDVFNVLGRDPAAKGSSLTFRPAGGSTNGLHPHIIIVDDPCDIEDRESPAVRERKKRWFDSLIPLLEPFEVPGFARIRKLMLIGTRWHLADIFAHVMEKNENAPTKRDCFDIEIEGVYLQDGGLNYPEFFAEDRINDIKSKTSSVFFSCQYLNQPLPEGVRVFEESKLHLIRPDQYDIKQGSNLCFFDPSQGKSGGDFPAAWWVNVLANRKIFYRAIDVRMPIAMIIGLLAQYNKEDNVKEMVFENNGTMDLLEERIRDAHAAAGHPIMITKIHETRNKVERITAMQPDLYNGSALFRADWRQCYPEAMSQIIYFPAWGHDDYPDTAEKALTYISRNSPGQFVTGSSGKTATAHGSIVGSIRSSKARSVVW